MSPITDHKSRLPCPLVIEIVQRILDAGGHAPVVLGCHEDEGAVFGDFGGPGLCVGGDVARGGVGFIEGGGDGGFVEEGEVEGLEVDGREG